MRKSNKLHSQRGLKRHQKNVNRKKRSEALKKFNDLAYRVKYMQAMLEQQQAAENPIAAAIEDAGLSEKVDA